jgi:hypothetical protein
LTVWYTTIAFGELEQLIEFVLCRIGMEIEAQADLAEADRRILGDAKRAAEIEIAFRRHPAGLERNIERGRHRLERDPGACNQGFQQHIAEHNSSPEPPVAGCRPATARARPVSILHATLVSSSVPLAFSVTTAACGSLR